MDKNKDGQVDPEEFEAWWSENEGACVRDSVQVAEHMHDAEEDFGKILNH